MNKTAIRDQKETPREWVEEFIGKHTEYRTNLETEIRVLCGMTEETHSILSRMYNIYRYRWDNLQTEIAKIRKKLNDYPDIGEALSELLQDIIDNIKVCEFLQEEGRRWEIKEISFHCNSIPFYFDPNIPIDKDTKKVLLEYKAIVEEYLYKK
jgi:hypothetical protein